MQPEKLEAITVTSGYKNEKLLRLLLSWPQLSIFGADHKDHSSGHENGGLSSYHVNRAESIQLVFEDAGLGTVFQCPKLLYIFLVSFCSLLNKIQNLSFL